LFIKSSGEIKPEVPKSERTSAKVLRIDSGKEIKYTVPYRYDMLSPYMSFGKY